MTTFSLAVMLELSKYVGSAVDMAAPLPYLPNMLAADMRSCPLEYTMLPAKLLPMLLALLEEKLRVVYWRMLMEDITVKSCGCEVDAGWM